MKKQYIVAKVKLVKASNKITVIASDETLDRHGDVLPIDQWDLTKFLGSPRMLVDHNHQVEKIVGRWENARIENKQLLMDANFHEITPLSKAVKEMVDGDYLDTVSVGFISHGPAKDGDRGSMELIETSWVTVPANPSARVMKAALDEQVSDEQKVKVKDFLKDLSDNGKPADDEDDEDEDESLEDAGDDDDDKIDDTEKDDEEELSLGTAITSVEMFKKLPKETLKVECSYDFIMQLVNDSEKLKTLTESEKAKVDAAFKSRLVQEALKEAARMVNHALKEINAAHKR